MWGDTSEGALGRPPPENNPKAFCYSPIKVDFFEDKMVYKIACGD